MILITPHEGECICQKRPRVTACGLFLFHDFLTNINIIYVSHEIVCRRWGVIRVNFISSHLHSTTAKNLIETTIAMYDPNTSYNTISVTQIVDCVAACVMTKGLQRAIEDFECMQNILSGLPVWNQVKKRVDIIFANERKRLEDVELARARAAAPNVYQVLQPAQNNVNMNNTTFTGPMYEVKDNEEVNLGGQTNG